MNSNDLKKADRKGLAIAIMNQKGGVGKTTTTINLSAALGEKKKKILVVDFDPQGNTTSGYGIEKGKIGSTIYDALINDDPVETTIIPTETKRVDIIPATIQLTGAEIELVPMMARESRLKEVLSPIINSYDYVIIDCPPSLGLLTINALTTANKLIVPIQCEFYALEGVTKMLDTIRLVKQRLNKNLELLGILMTMYDKRTTLSNQVIDEVRDYFGEQVFDTVIPRSVKLAEAPGFGMPVTKYAPSHRGAEAYRSLAKEVIRRG